MKIDFSPRQSGKTTRMIEWLREDRQRILLVPTVQRVRELQNLLNEMYPGEINPLEQIMSFSDFLANQKSFHPLYRVAIDDVEELLKHIVRVPIERISLSNI